jgi:anaerobic ribonucleoside-triphosphate reductase activating protein
MELYLSRAHFPVTTLGPGRRLGIWFQGCSIHCPGCISLDTWALGRGRIELALLLGSISNWVDEADGITISGGEPFDQIDALHLLLTELRARTSADILVFTGYSLEDLPSFARFDGVIDALITDPYRADLPQRLALRGSDNQRLHCLTPLGSQRFAQFEREREPSDDRLDVGIDEDGTVWMAGIPKRGDVERLVESLRSLGHQAQGTFDVRVPDDRVRS